MISTVIEVEDEDDEGERALYASRCESSDDLMGNADEPLADEEWLKKYEAENEENKLVEQELQAGLAEVSGAPNVNFRKISVRKTI